MSDDIEIFDHWELANDPDLTYEVRGRRKLHPIQAIIEIIECSGGESAETVTLYLDDARRLHGALGSAIVLLEAR